MVSGHAHVSAPYWRLPFLGSGFQPFTPAGPRSALLAYVSHSLVEFINSCRVYAGGNFTRSAIRLWQAGVLCGARQLPRRGTLVCCNSACLYIIIHHARSEGVGNAWAKKDNLLALAQLWPPRSEPGTAITTKLSTFYSLCAYLTQ